MAEQFGWVLRTFEDHTAEVMTDKKDACGGCRDKRDCKSCLAGNDKVVAIVQNDAGARRGDVVRIQHKTKALFGGAALFYFVPVFGLMAGAFIGDALAAGWNADASVSAVLGGMAGVVVGLATVIGITRTEGGRRRLVPHIVGILKSDASGRVRTIAHEVPDSSKHSCCTG